WSGTASYNFGLIGLQGSVSQFDEIYGVQPHPVVSSRTEGGFTLFLRFRSLRPQLRLAL
ncbi:MAG: hypothetical protein K0S81_3252, partial [Rhodospirillales bacterium]|nr:hypothetical protein [Rhodospirillales bacterium]